MMAVTLSFVCLLGAVQARLEGANGQEKQVSPIPSIPTTQIDIPGPAGSGSFGRTVTVLPNGNFVVTDPTYRRARTSRGCGRGLPL